MTASTLYNVNTNAKAHKIHSIYINYVISVEVRPGALGWVVPHDTYQPTTRQNALYLIGNKIAYTESKQPSQFIVGVNVVTMQWARVYIVFVQMECLDSRRI